jgi:ribosomal protein S18 acetylase RimI-like enzyme
MGAICNDMEELSLRPAAAEDEPFLFEVYASTRRAEVADWGWDDAQRDAFLQSQFRAQQQSYEMHYEGAESQLILLEGKLAGRILVLRSELEILGVDIALLPEYRGAGIGSRLIGQLQAEAAATGKRFVFQVQRTNQAAIRLYQRLGFIVVGGNDFTHSMEWRRSSEAE